MTTWNITIIAENIVRNLITFSGFIIFGHLTNENPTPMKKALILLMIFLTGATLSNAQESSGERQNNIRAGFYMKLGPVFPTGSYAAGQTTPVLVTKPGEPSYLIYSPAKIGAALDMGYLIYFGPSFANKYLRAGIDVTFLNVWFNTADIGTNSNRWKHYYYNLGQKIGPLLTFNPIDRLMIDISYKINANLAIYYGEWDDFESDQYSNYGFDIFHQEVSLGLRYRAMVLSFQYNFGTINYDNIRSERTDQSINANTFRILFGVKF